MIDPPVEPPFRKTAHGAICSPRLSRLYTWLNNNGVSISDFSTDQCVERNLKTLLTLGAALDRLRETASARYLDDLAADLGNLLRRRPSMRVAAR
jgi:hypothetical protein